MTSENGVAAIPNPSEKSLPLLLHVFQCLLGKVFLKSFSIVILPLLTFYLSTEEMGIYQLLLGGMGIFIEIMTFGTRQLFEVHYVKYQNPGNRLKLVRNNLWIYLRFTSLAFAVLLSLFAWRVDPKYIGICTIAVFSFYLNIFNEIHLSSLRLQQKFFQYNFISLLFGSLQFCFVYSSVVLFDMRLYGLILSFAATELLQFSYTAWQNRKTIRNMRLLNEKSRFRLASLLPYLKYAIIFVPSTLSFWLLTNVDQWMLGALSNLNQVGLYTFACKFPLFFDFLLSSSFILVYTPHLFKGLRADFAGTGKQNLLVSLLGIAFSLLIYIAAQQTAPLLSPWISANFQPALQFIPSLLLIACIRFSTHILQLAFRFQHQIKVIIGTNIISILVNIILNSLWIPDYGIQGCLSASVASFALMYLLNFLWHFRMVQKETVLQTSQTYATP